MPGIQTDECPVSYIKPESIETLQILSRARHVHGAFGGSLFGPDLSQWPDSAIEASATVAAEQISLENVRRSSETPE